MFKKILSYVLATVVFTSSLSALSVGAVSSQEKITLNISVVTTKTDNDLLNVLNANYNGIKQYTTLDKALNDVETNGTKGIMMLSDKYPDIVTAVTAKQAQKIKDLGLRLYIEYPKNNATLGITGYDDKDTMEYKRAVVTNAEATGMELYNILYVHGAKFAAKTDIENSWVVCANVAGYDKADFGLTDCTPYSLLEEVGDVLIASTKLSQFISARYAPQERWQKLWISVLSWLSKTEVGYFDYTQAVTPHYGKTDTLPASAYTDAINLNTQWYINNMLPKADGSAGFYQCFNSGKKFDYYGDQSKNLGIRADCTAESIGAFALAGEVLNNDEYKKIAYNAMSWMLNESLMANGDRADPESSQYGLLSWYDEVANQGSYYGDDNAKAILGLILGAAALDTDEFDQRILEAILGNFRTTGQYGYRGSMLKGTDLDKYGWEHYYNGNVINYASHFESMLWACYLWAYEKTGYEPLLERTKTAISMMMDSYAETMKNDLDSGAGEWFWTNGIQADRAKFIMSLAWLVRIEPTEEHIKWLDTMISDMMMFQDTAIGALRDVVGEPGQGRGMCGPFKTNSEYGTKESPVIQNNGDPCSDSLYTASFAMVTLNEAYAAMKSIGNEELAAEYQNYAKTLSDYHIKIQQVSDTKSKYNGVWFRGFDYEKWESYGSDGDAGWGIWCTETGWSQAQISSALSLQTLNTNIWDYSKKSTAGNYFTETAAVMLNYKNETKPSVSSDTALRKGTDLLVDGQYGSAQWGDGKWTGAEGKDINLVIDYKENKSFNKVEIGLNQNMLSGVCLPSEVTFYASKNGVDYTKIGTYTGTNDVQAEYNSRNEDGAFIVRASVTSPNIITARYIKIEVKNPGTFEKEDGKTYKTWVFMDEVELKWASMIIDVTSQNATVKVTDKDGNPIPEEGVEKGESVTLKIIPNENCYIKSVRVNNQSVKVNGDSFVIENIDTAQFVEVVCAEYEEAQLPVINAKEWFITKEEAANFDPLIDTVAIDKEGNDITSSMIISGTVGTAVGEYPLTYKVTDKKGAVRKITANVYVSDTLGDTHVLAVTPSDNSKGTTKSRAQKLVDGVLVPEGSGHGNAGYTAWKNQDNIEVVTVFKNSKVLDKLGYSLASCPQYGYLSPDVDFYITDNLQNGWTYVGRLEAEAHPNTNMAQVANIRRSIDIGGKSAKYIKYIFRFDDNQEMLDRYKNTPGKGIPEWTFVDEVTFVLHQHSGTHHTSVSQSCSSEGKKEYWSCSCGKLFLDADCTTEVEESALIIPKDPHRWNSETGKCDICGEKCVHRDENGDKICDICGKTTVIIGDIDGDGIVTAKDLGALMQYINGWNVAIVEDAADVNGDGSIDAKDYGLLMQYLNGWDVTLKQ